MLGKFEEIKKKFLLLSREFEENLRKELIKRANFL